MSAPGQGLTRRRALGLLAAGTVAVGAGVGGLALRRDESPDDDPVASTPIPGAHDALVALGARYLATHPDESDSAALAAVLGSTPEAVRADPGAALRDRYETIRAEAAAGDIVDVDGWVLSATECRVAALLASA